MIAYRSVIHSYRTEATMLKSSVCAAALAGLLLGIPSQGWSQGRQESAGAHWLALSAIPARYDVGVALERAGHMTAAMQAYREAAESGHGLAQKRLGDIYGTGYGPVERDYVTSLRWYQRAREQGVDIPQPFSYPGVRR